MTTQTPPDYAEGYGELVRAHRVYMGLSQRTLADRIGMGERSLSDIEVGRRRCPPGFIDTIKRIADEFDEQVQKVIGQCDAAGCAKIPVNDDPQNEWERSIVGRAAVESGLIMPIIDGIKPAREPAWSRT